MWGNGDVIVMLLLIMKILQYWSSNRAHRHPLIDKYPPIVGRIYLIQEYIQYQYMNSTMLNIYFPIVGSIYPIQIYEIQGPNLPGPNLPRTVQRHPCRVNLKVSPTDWLTDLPTNQLTGVGASVLMHLKSGKTRELGKGWEVEHLIGGKRNNDEDQDGAGAPT